jgi:hypothetical protein
MATANADRMTEAELEAATAPPSPKPDRSAPVSQEEFDRRWAEGLPSPFDSDDDETDENLEDSIEPEDPKADDEKDGKKKDAKAETEGDAAPEPDADEEKVDEKVEGEADPAAETDPAIVALHERAKVYKLDPAKFTDPEVLEAAVTAIAEATAAAGEEILEAEEAAAKAAETEAEPEAAKAKVDAEADPAADKKPRFDNTGKKIEFKVDKLSKEEYAPELIEALEEMRDTIVELRAGRDKTQAELAQERADRAKEQAAQQAARDEAEARESTRRIDAFFAKKAKESPVWVETFGEKPAAELLKTDEGKKLFANRCQAVRKRDALVAGLQSRKLPTEDVDASLDTGVMIAFRDKYAAAATKKVVEKVNERRNSGIPRPNPSRSATPKGSALRATLKKHGMSPEDEG